MRRKRSKVISGTVCSLHPNRRFGFVHSDDFDRDLFFSCDDLGAAASKLKIGAVLRGTVEQGPKGPRLVAVRVVSLTPTSPTLLYALLSLIAVVGLASGIWLNFEVSLLVAYLLAINVGSLFFMGLDKSLARSASIRTPETIMFVLATLGGSAGVLLGIHVFKHKTKKAGFQFVLLLIFLSQFVILRALGVELRPTS